MTRSLRPTPRPRLTREQQEREALLRSTRRWTILARITLIVGLAAVTAFLMVTEPRQDSVGIQALTEPTQFVLNLTLILLGFAAYDTFKLARRKLRQRRHHQPQLRN